MHAVRALINKDRNRRIRARVWNMLNHFFHDEWVANHESDHPGRVTSGFFADNRAVIKFRKQHQARFPYRLLDRAFQLSDRARSMRRSPELSHVGMAYRVIYSCKYLIKRLGGDQGESLHLDFPYPPTSCRTAPERLSSFPPGGRNRGCTAGSVR